MLYMASFYFHVVPNSLDADLVLLVVINALTQVGRLDLQRSARCIPKLGSPPSRFWGGSAGGWGTGGTWTLRDGLLELKRTTFGRANSACPASELRETEMGWVKGNGSLRHGEFVQNLPHCVQNFFLVV